MILPPDDCRLIIFDWDGTLMDSSTQEFAGCPVSGVVARSVFTAPLACFRGHSNLSVGDILLTTFADRLQGALRQTDFVARLGGDEFVLVFEDLRNMDDLELVLARIQGAIEVPFILPGGDSVTVGGSLGLTFYPFDDGDPDLLLRHADQAPLYHQGNKGKSAAILDLLSRRYGHGRDRPSAKHGHPIRCGRLARPLSTRH
ncbi:diguanylate cyclase domain-containing protein [Acidithiobacillus ferrivorans]|uniref:diguanylate cyclase domain-containing protein n=1 Tax=Acidithiobacillus ferrivorans TaxID=160808 RepID=UPI00020D2BD9|nr:GGDEF domain-containing protein [Acidithiobacillus ferrivorans]OFA16951.1 hypothetical protein A4U49_04475 [Acidithiobacillus ferrivorans]